MRSKSSSSFILPERLFSHLVLIFTVLFLLISSGSALAYTPQGVSFSWKANPAEDYVVGYRLYYSSESRFDYNGNLKTNFSYDYYIDFSESERCVPGTDGTDCKILELTDLQCGDLYGDSPECTIHNLQGVKYLAMTAYNAQAESDYTYELKYIDIANKLAAVQMIQSILILKD